MNYLERRQRRQKQGPDGQGCLLYTNEKNRAMIVLITQRIPWSC